MRALWAVMLAVVLPVGASLADRVRTKDGKTYTGAVEIVGDVVVVTQADGGSVALKRPDVSEMTRDGPAEREPAKRPVGPGGAAERHLTPARERILEQLAKPVTVDFPGTSFDNVIEFLQDLTGMNIVVDMRARLEEGITPDTTIRLKLSNVRLSDCLTLALDQVNLDYVVTDAAVILTNAGGARNLQLKEGLDRPITLEVENEWFANVLVDLHKQTGLTVKVAPGALAYLPNGGKTPVTLRVRDLKARQVYEYLGNLLNLEFRVEDGTATYAGPVGVAAKPAAAPDDPIVGRIVTKDETGSVTELYVRQSEMPERLRHLRAEKIKSLVRLLEAELAAERSSE